MVQMGVKCIVLEAAHRQSLDVWIFPAMGFSVLKQCNFLQLKDAIHSDQALKSDRVVGRLVKLTAPAALVEQVSLTDLSFPLCHANIVAQ